MTSTSNDKNILFFDGDCALCSFWVQFCMERDRRKALYYAPLQGATAAQLLPELVRKELNTVVFWQNGNYTVRSEAILGALKVIRYAPDVLMLAGLIPTRIRNGTYDFVANRRIHWFGKKDTCALVPEPYRSQLLN